MTTFPLKASPVFMKEDRITFRKNQQECTELTSVALIVSDNTQTISQSTLAIGDAYIRDVSERFICSENLDDYMTPYLIEPEKNEKVTSINGRRMIDIVFFLNKLKEILSHKSLFNCGIQCLILLGEKRIGVASKFKLMCEMCGMVFHIDSDDPATTENDDMNTGAVVGIIYTGIAYSQLEEICSSMNIPTFSERYFSKIQDKVFDEWERTAAEEMEAAAERENEAAIAEGRTKNGIPNRRTVASKSQSLVEDVDTNAAERFNSVIAKMVGGKRIIFCLRRGYQERCAAAVVSFNNKLPRHTIQKKLLGKKSKKYFKEDGNEKKQKKTMEL
ncbi:unnamed protein product [Parnassius apollo]|uniref:(apollo) hypothetical protein n=1 Tax=Parnassius apollo TaxID=110799 RepID=A0A8S3VYE9_PARAO|nr:unnamed protein product [Parnassius apollo]